MDPNQVIDRARTHLRVVKAHSENDQQVGRMAAVVARQAAPAVQSPVMFFDASTRLTGMSLNAGFALLTSWSLALQSVPVVHFVCYRGMTQCVLGTDRGPKGKNPPCGGCVAQSRAFFSHAQTIPFEFTADEKLDALLATLGLEELEAFTFNGMPLGALVLPSARWILRRHHLQPDPVTLRILHEYIRSAWSIKLAFERALDQVQPQAVLVFNGMQYPEAAARWTARQRGVKVYSHEVGLRPTSAFFTEGDATAYPLSIPDDFKLDENQTARLDDYLGKRFQGNFHMAGVQFWPEMSNLDPTFVELSKHFKQMVPVFTNVIFDTSQPHANVLFEDMFTWLDSLLNTAKAHPETLFVIRAHPDEARKGKASEESVSEWAEQRQLGAYTNIKYIPPTEFISSYDLVRMAKLVLVYNSTIGLEASILGAPVLSAGKSRYSGAGAVWLPATLEEYQEQLERYLRDETITVPADFARNARRFLYWQLFRSSLSFERYLEPDGIWPGYVKLKPFDWQDLLPGNSTTLETISNGILCGGDFMLGEDNQ